MTPPEGGPSSGIGALLRIADFRRIWSAQAISDLGDGMTNLALLLVVTLLTGSTAALALMAISLAIPSIVVGPFAGVFVDRWDRRRVMLASDLARAVVVLGFAVVHSPQQVWILYGLGFCHASISAFFTPARMAIVPRIVPPGALLAANSLGQGTRVVAGVAGGMTAGLCVGLLGVAWPAFVADALTFVASFLLVLGVRTGATAAGLETGHAAPPRRSVRAELLEGFETIAHSPALLGSLIGGGCAMLGLGAVNVLFVPLVIRVLDQPATWMGALDGAETASMVMAASVVGFLASRLRPTTIAQAGLVGSAVFCLALAGVTELWQVLLLLFAVGWFVTPLNAAIQTIVQHGVEDARLGRVGSTLNSVFSFTSVISMAFAGAFGDLIGVRAVFLIAAAIVGASAVTAGFLYRRADGMVEPAGDAAQMPGHLTFGDPG